MAIAVLVVGAISKTTKVVTVMIVVALTMIDEWISWITALIVHDWPFVEERRVVLNHNVTKPQTTKG